MKRGFLAVAGACLAGVATAEVKDDHFVIGPEQVWIDVIEPVEIMWVGPNEYERTQVLSGPDIEVVGEATDADTAAMLGARAIVATVPGTHSCDAGDARGYYVITLGTGLATDGPLSTCVELVMSVTSGAIVLQEDPMGEGEAWVWRPGLGFDFAAN